VCGTKPSRSIVEGKKRCNDCETWFPADKEHFYKLGKNKNGSIRWAPYCKSCSKKRDRARERKNGVSRRKAYKYKVSHKTIVALHSKGCCQVCGETDQSTFVIDHDHKTGEVRDLLCRSCNLILGYAKDNPEILRKLADYLNHHSLQDQ
jgi:hypothetical protein